MAGSGRGRSRPARSLVKPSIVYKVQWLRRPAGDGRSHQPHSDDGAEDRPDRGRKTPTSSKLTVLSPNQVQISAKATGVTQINLWDENKRLYTVNVLVVGDARELAMILRATFPDAALKVTPVASSVMLSGFVDKTEHIDRIIQIAEQYYPKVINNMSVGGVQQVLLHVKVMEVSRTKLRQLGVDWAKITGNNFIIVGPERLVSDFNPSALTTPPELFRTGTPGLSLSTSAAATAVLCRAGRDARRTI